MNKYLQKLICLSVGIAALLTPSFGHAAKAKHSCSSHSSSDPCETADGPRACKIKAPPYITSEDGEPTMHFVVLNRSSRISSELLKQVLRAVKKQVSRDFVPFYGIHAHFKVVRDQNHINWTTHVPLIIDDFLPDSAGCDFISFHSLQATDGNGFPINEAVFNPPPIPNGTPYIVVPIGDSSTCYGVTPAFNGGAPFLPQTFDGLFSQAVSHEVLETLHNYTTNLATLDYSGDFFGPDTIVGFIDEVCDPVSFSRGYEIHGLNVANFVLPSYWVNDLSVGPYDFLNTVQAPFIPYGGTQDLLLTFPCGAAFLTIVSPPPCIDDPTDFDVFGNPIFSCDPTPAALASGITSPRFLKGKSPIMQDNPGKRKKGVFRLYKAPSQNIAQEAA
ncbi:MAG: hypothetical protein JSR46_01260 [Verrucomicrobia bacterium]|nr:hypothetical protein [Verrucomicrobiota bacterium]